MNKGVPNRKHKRYDKDFYAWALGNASLLRQGRVMEIDVENIAEEIESMGKSEKRELLNRLSVLIAHLIKWKYQAKKRSRSWELTIKEQRFEIADLLADSPSLKVELESNLPHAYQKALIHAERESKLAKKTFERECPFSLKQLLNQKYFPE